jgi:putative sigma-54 modulation protein
MAVNITFRNLDSSDAIRDYALDRVARVKKYIESPFDANVVLSVEKFRHIAEITISMDGSTINGQEETGDLYSAIDMVMDKIERQIKKHRGKITKRKGGNRNKGVQLQYIEEVIAPESSEEEGVRIIKTESLYAKPMDVEEAVMQLDLSENDFLVFTNSRSQKINVVYRRSDGHYGLIQPLNS